MKPFDPELAAACATCVEHVCGSDDAEAAVALAGLLRFPADQVAAWCAGAVVGLADDVDDQALYMVVSRRITEPGVVAGVVRALRGHNMRALVVFAGADAVSMFVTLIVVAAALAGWKA